MFFFKQKTAYEMRMSDWSSDVCSSDLPAAGAAVAGQADRPAAPDLLARLHQRAARLQVGVDGHGSVVVEDADQVRVAVPAGRWRPGHPDPHHHAVARGAHPRDRAGWDVRVVRSEARTVGTECVTPGSSRGWPALS